MKNKIIELLARQIINYLPKYKTIIITWIGYVISAYNLLLSPEMIQNIHDSFGWDLSTNKWLGIISGIMAFLVNVTRYSTEIKHQEEIKKIKNLK